MRIDTAIRPDDAVRAANRKERRRFDKVDTMADYGLIDAIHSSLDSMTDADRVGAMLILGTCDAGAVRRAVDPLECGLVIRTGSLSVLDDAATCLRRSPDVFRAFRRIVVFCRRKDELHVAPIAEACASAKLSLRVFIPDYEDRAAAEVLKARLPPMFAGWTPSPVQVLLNDDGRLLVGTRRHTVFAEALRSFFVAAYDGEERAISAVMELQGCTREDVQSWFAGTVLPTAEQVLRFVLEWPFFAHVPVRLPPAPPSPKEKRGVAPAPPPTTVALPALLAPVRLPPLPPKAPRATEAPMTATMTMHKAALFTNHRASEIDQKFRARFMNWGLDVEVHGPKEDGIQLDRFSFVILMTGGGAVRAENHGRLRRAAKLAGKPFVLLRNRISEWEPHLRAVGLTPGVTPDVVEEQDTSAPESDPAPISIPQAFGPALKALRENEGLGLSDLAALVSVGDDVLGRIENQEAALVPPELYEALLLLFPDLARAERPSIAPTASSPAPRHVPPPLASTTDLPAYVQLIEADNEALRTRLQFLEGAERRSADAQAELRKALDAAVLNTASFSKAADTARSEVATLSREVDALTRDKHANADALDALQKAVAEERAAWNDDLARKRSLVSRLETENNGLRAEVEALQAKLRDAQRPSTDRARVQELERDVADLRRQLAARGRPQICADPIRDKIRAARMAVNEKLLTATDAFGKICDAVEKG